MILVVTMRPRSPTIEDYDSDCVMIDAPLSKRHSRRGSESSGTLENDSDIDEDIEESPINADIQDGNMVINIEDFEDQFEAEIFGPDNDRPLASPRKGSILRNAPIRLPWVKEDSLQFHNITLRSGKTVELGDGTFLHILDVIRNVQDDEIKLRGWALKRCSSLGGLLPKKLNELCMIFEVELDDPRPLDVQCMIEVDLANIVKVRQLVRTNYPFPSHRFDLPNQIFDSKDEIEQHVRDEGRLVARWKYTTVYPSRAARIKVAKYPADSLQKKLEALSSEECSTGRYLDPSAKRLHWRDSVCRGPVRQQGYTFGDAFCGAGGATRGALMAGLVVKWGLDKDANSGETWRLNFPNAEHFELWVDQLVKLDDESKDLLVDVLHMSPPCQVWSPVHTRVGKDDQQNFTSLFACQQILEEAKPRNVTLEQTFGILHPKFSQPFNSLIQVFTSQGYSVSWQLVKFEKYGLPQSRCRLIIIAAGPGETLPEIPGYTHSANRGDGLKPLKSVNATISKIPRNAPHHDVGAMLKHRIGKKKVLISWDGSKVIGTICCNGGEKGHPNGMRKFTIAELAALQTFPPNHQWIGTLTALRKQIGNAVPPSIGKILYRSIIKHLENTDGVKRDFVVLED